MKSSVNRHRTQCPAEKLQSKEEPVALLTNDLWRILLGPPCSSESARFPYLSSKDEEDPRWQKKRTRHAGASAYGAVRLCCGAETTGLMILDCLILERWSCDRERREQHSNDHEESLACCWAGEISATSNTVNFQASVRIPTRQQTHREQR